MKTAYSKLWLIAAIVGTICLLALLYWLLHEEASVLMSYAVDEKTPPLLFIGLYIVLPLIGFPISPFLVLLGIKFGGWLGVLIMFAGMPLHLAVALFLSHSFLRSWLRKLFEKLDYRLPKIPANREAWFGFVFMAVPGLSYALKNYILALSGISKRIFLLSGFWVQGIMGVPLVILGDAAAEKHLFLLIGIVIVLLLLYAFIYHIRKRLKIDVSKT